MIRKALLGAAAGAVGTVVLDAVAYGDEGVCGMGPSSVPSLIAGQSNDKLGVDLSSDNEESGGSTAQNRRASCACYMDSSWTRDRVGPNELS